MRKAGTMYMDHGIFRIDLPLPEGVKDYYAFLDPSNGIPAIATLSEDTDTHMSSSNVREYKRVAIGHETLWINQYLEHTSPGTPEYEALERLSEQSHAMKN